MLWLQPQRINVVCVWLNATMFIVWNYSIGATNVLRTASDTFLETPPELMLPAQVTEVQNETQINFWFLTFTNQVSFIGNVLVFLGILLFLLTLLYWWQTGKRKKNKKKKKKKKKAT